jgi:hypothetical protein
VAFPATVCPDGSVNVIALAFIVDGSMASLKEALILDAGLIFADPMPGDAATIVGAAVVFVGTNTTSTQ